MKKRMGFIFLLLISCQSNAQPQVENLVKPDQQKVLQPLITAADADAFKDLVIFGDSLSDTGRLHSRSVGLYIPPEVYWKGRLTNGPNWTDYVCGALGCNAHNYAVAGAATRLSKVPLRWVVRPLDAQVDEFLSEAPQLSANRSAAVIWIGPNNYLRQIDPHPDAVHAEILASATELLKGPVEKLLIGTMPQLAGILHAPDTKDPVSDEAYRRVTFEHNRHMLMLLSELQQRFPNKAVALYDAYAINQATIDHPADYGFTSLTEGCYKGNYRGHFHGERTFCADYLGFKFWDYTHPNSRMHCFYATQFLLSLQEAGWLRSFDADRARAICRNL